MSLLTAVAPAIIGGLFGMAQGSKNRQSAEAAAQRNYEQQMEFAKHGIRWKVQDAKAAGIHPLYALGAHGVSFQPSSVGYQGDELSNMGQSIERAIKAGTSYTERKRAEDIEAETVRNMRLKNDLLEFEILTRMSEIRDVGEQGSVYGPDANVLSGTVNDITGKPDANYTAPVIENMKLPGTGAGIRPNEVHGMLGRYVSSRPSQEYSELQESVVPERIKYAIFRGERFADGMFFHMCERYYPRKLWTKAFEANRRAHHNKIRYEMRPTEKYKGWHWRYNPEQGFVLYKDKYPGDPGCLYEDCRGRIPN